MKWMNVSESCEGKGMFHFQQIYELTSSWGNCVMSFVGKYVIFPLYMSPLKSLVKNSKWSIIPVSHAEIQLKSLTSQQVILKAQPSPMQLNSIYNISFRGFSLVFLPLVEFSNLNFSLPGWVYMQFISSLAKYPILHNSDYWIHHKYF